jgi:hypothetical protein
VFDNIKRLITGHVDFFPHFYRSLLHNGNNKMEDLGVPIDMAFRLSARQPSGFSQHLDPKYQFLFHYPSSTAQQLVLLLQDVSGSLTTLI